MTKWDYIYEDFLEPELEQVAKAYKNGTLKNVEIHLVCLVAYNETTEIQKKSESQIKNDILNIISNRCKKINSNVYDCFNAYETLLTRMNYIIFPLWEMKNLIMRFQRAIGR